MVSLNTSAATLKEENVWINVNEEDYGYSGYPCKVISIESDLFKASYSEHYIDNNPAKGISYYNGAVVTDVVDANYMVTNVAYNGDEPVKYLLQPLLNTGSRYVMKEISQENVLLGLKGEMPKPGDLVKVEQYDDWGESFQLYPYPEDFENELLGAKELFGSPTFTNYGNGVELLGEDFKKVLYYATISNGGTDYSASNDFMDFHSIESRLSALGIDFYDKGNVDNSDNVDILDVVLVNRNILGKFQFNAYAKGCADVNSDGVVDASDSLNIMKKIVGIVDSFDEIKS